MEDLAWLSESVRSGDTLTEDDIIYMYEEADLHSLGALARELADRPPGTGFRLCRT